MTFTLVGSAISVDDQADVLTLARRSAMLLELDGMPHGPRRARALVKLADALYAEHELPELLGTEARAFQQMVYSDFYAAPLPADAPERLEVADPAAAAFEHVTQGQAGMTWPTRRRLQSVRLRASESAHANALVTSADRPDAMFVGHTLVKRGQLARTNVKRTAHRTSVRKANTVAEGPLPTDAAELEQAIHQLKPGQRASYTHAGQHVTITRGKAAVSVTIRDGQASRKLSGNRTALGAARRILTHI